MANLRIIDCHVNCHIPPCEDPLGIEIKRRCEQAGLNVAIAIRSNDHYFFVLLYADTEANRTSAPAAPAAAATFIQVVFPAAEVNSL